MPAIFKITNFNNITKFYWSKNLQKSVYNSKYNSLILDLEFVNQRMSILHKGHQVHQILKTIDIFITQNKAALGSPKYLKTGKLYSYLTYKVRMFQKTLNHLYISLFAHTLNLYHPLELKLANQIRHYWKDTKTLLIIFQNYVYLSSYWRRKKFINVSVIWTAK